MSNIHFELFKFMNEHGDKTQDVRKSVMPDREMKEYIVKMRYGMEIGYGQELVRCKDCIYGDDFDCPAPLPTGYVCQKRHGSHTGDWFCADGRKR